MAWKDGVTGKRLLPFTDYWRLLDRVKRYEYLYYQAPLDYAPVLVQVVKYTVHNEKKEKSTITFKVPNLPAVTVGMVKHLDRFRYREE